MYVCIYIYIYTYVGIVWKGFISVLFFICFFNDVSLLHGFNVTVALVSLLVTPICENAWVRRRCTWRVSASPSPRWTACPLSLPWISTAATGRSPSPSPSPTSTSSTIPLSPPPPPPNTSASSSACRTRRTVTRKSRITLDYFKIWRFIVMFVNIFKGDPGRSTL